METTDEPQLSRAQRKKLKKEERRKERELEFQNKQKSIKIKKLRNYSVALVVLILIVGFWYWNSLPPENAPLLNIDTVAHNLGKVSQKEGVVSVMSEVTNTGDKDLVINAITTSCMCTTASLIVDGKESPTFGMHSKFGSWNQKIKPNQEAQLKISYDPMAHPELRGPVTRIVTLASNDPQSPRKEVRISLNQVS